MNLVKNYMGQVNLVEISMRTSVNYAKILMKFGENTRGTMVNYVKIYMSVFGITTMYT